MDGSGYTAGRGDEGPNGGTPLHVAAEYDNVIEAELLLEEGARVMAKEKMDTLALIIQSLLACSTC